MRLSGMHPRLMIIIAAFRAVCNYTYLYKHGRLSYIRVRRAAFLRRADVKLRGRKSVYGICGAEMRKAAKPISRAASAADARQARLRKGGKARGGRRRRTPGPAGPGAAKLLQYPTLLF